MTDQRAKRKLTAIFSADVKGYSRLMADDDEATVRTISAYRDLMRTLISSNGGRVLDAKGDNVLAEFPSVVDAVRCAVEVQRELGVRNAGLPQHRRMEFRIGVNLGDVIEERETIYGDGVNVAARLEGLAEGGGICISGTAFDQVKGRIPVGYAYQGRQAVKNIPDKVRVYKLLLDPADASKVIGEEEPQRRKRQWLSIAAVALLFAFGGLIWHVYFKPDMEPAQLERMAFPLPDKPSIAVLPFVNMSDEPRQSYFSDGITEDLITALSKTPKMLVIARDSTFSYKGKAVKAQRIAEELGVRYVLQGSVRKSANQVRVTAQLIDALKGQYMWGERYDRDLKDIFQLQDEITKEVITSLQVELTEGEQARLSAKGTDNIAAYLTCLEGREHLFGFNKDDNLTARREAEKAIALDPQYSDAYSLLGKTHIMDVWFKWSDSPKASLGRASELARKALDLKADNFEAHRILSHVYLLNRQHDKAIEECELAVKLAPNVADCLYNLGLVLRFSGRPKDAVSAFEKAIRLNPIPPPSYWYQLGLTYAFLGRFDKALELCNKALPQNPNDLVGRITLAVAYASLGREEEARKEAAQMIRIDPGFNLEHASKTWPYKKQEDMELVLNALRKSGLPEKPPLPLPDKPSIAVLPFDNMSGDPEQEYFTDGITEEIITALSKTPKLFVIARNSSFTYKGRSVWIPTVARELGVRYILEGSVRIIGDNVRVTAQLIDAITSNHIWAERYDRHLENIFFVQDDITKNIISALQVNLTEGEQANVYAKGTENLEAYLKAMKAHWLYLQGTREGVLKALDLAEEAIALDPGFAFAYKVLGGVHGMSLYLGLSQNPREALAQAIDLHRKAVELDDSLAIAHAALGYWLIMARRYDEGVAQGERAIRLEPSSADVIHAYAAILTFVGRQKEAIPLFNEALRLNPYPPNTYLRHYGVALRDSGQYADAVEQAKRAIAKEPNDLIAYVVLTSSYSLAGLEAEARAAAREILRINPRYSVAWQEKVSPHKDREVAKRLGDSLRKAGLPE